MNEHCFILLLLIVERSFGFKANHQIDRLTKSIFSNKQYKESFTPARYKVGMKNLNFEQFGCDTTAPQQYFPDVEYPANTMDVSRPFFYKTGECNAMLGPFPDDVKSSYKTLLDKNREAFEALKTKYMNDFPPNARNCIEEKTAPMLKMETTEEAETAFEEVGDETEEEVNRNMSSQESTVEDNNAIEENELIETTIQTGEAISDDNVEYFDTDTQAVEENNEEPITEDNFQSWESQQQF